MESAAQTVFATAELLEEILLELPVRSLARSKMAAKRWSDTIAASPKLRDRLAFREPTPYTLKKWWMRPYTLNPRLLRMKKKLSKNLELHRPYLDRIDHDIAIDHQALFDLPTTSLQEFISQPPETEAYVTLALVEDDITSVCSIPLTTRDGITFATLRQSMIEKLEFEQKLYSDKTLILTYFWVGLYEVPDTDKSWALTLKNEYGNLP